MSQSIIGRCRSPLLSRLCVAASESTTTTCLRSRHYDSNVVVSDEQIDEALQHDADTSFAKEFFQIPGAGHRLFLIQPIGSVFKKSIHQMDPMAQPELQVDENKALVATLPRWRVVKHAIATCHSYRMKTIFGRGNYQDLIGKARSAGGISAVMLGIDVLSGTQYNQFTEDLQMPVYDRYRIVLEIFRRHAKTRESKLQVELAQLPYLRAKLSQCNNDFRYFHGEGSIVGSHSRLSKETISKALNVSTSVFKFNGACFLRNILNRTDS